ncbi:MAG: zeta toxin family protein [Clostridiales bacterium]|jgi:predicted ABC-type ATPase|nr:zeta toxin family protein [Clostridiales bacterium]
MKITVESMGKAFKIAAQNAIIEAHNNGLATTHGDGETLYTLEPSGVAREIISPTVRTNIAETKLAPSRELIVFAGPNGSGKSTLTREWLAENPQYKAAIYVNADDIKKEGCFSSEAARGYSYEEKFNIIAQTDEDISKNPLQLARYRDDLIAAKIADDLRKRVIDKGDNALIMETVLSTPRNLELMREAKKAGYEITTVYVLTQNPEINVARVANRASLGGHEVPKDSIIRRYDACLRLLGDVISASDNIMVFDNSGETPKLSFDKKISIPKQQPKLKPEYRL